MLVITALTAPIQVKHDSANAERKVQVKAERHELERVHARDSTPLGLSTHQSATTHRQTLALKNWNTTRRTHHGEMPRPHSTGPVDLESLAWLTVARGSRAVQHTRVRSTGLDARSVTTPPGTSRWHALIEGVEQLGLKLESRLVPIEATAIDVIRRAPTEN